jgi:outer membrane protein assembly factor BamE (lipoprotein component of BamABCDE complex)
MSTPEPLTTKNSQLTHGNVQLSIRVGQTTKADILERFGSPNITTRDGQGREVWTYQRSAQVSQSSGKVGYWNILLFGEAGRNSGFESSSQMITLIIKFDKSDIVADFRSRTSSF